jgi:N-carbamoylputrescine amidase
MFPVLKAVLPLTCSSHFYILFLLFQLLGLLFNSTAVAMAKVKVAIAQIRCVDSDMEGNLERISRMAAQAKSQGAQLVFFPETADLGWVNPQAHELAGPVPGPFSGRVSELARSNEIWIGIGLCEKHGDRLYDSALLIDPSGEIVLKHRKINLLDWLMEPPYTAGSIENIKAVQTPFGRIGVMICADSFKEDLREAMLAQRPDLVYIPYGWAAPREKWPEHSFSLVMTVQKAARHVGAVVIGPNLVGEITHGPWKGQTFEGLSTAADRDGMSLVQGKWNKEDLLVIEVEPGHVSRTK